MLRILPSWSCQVTKAGRGLRRKKSATVARRFGNDSLRRRCMPGSEVLQRRRLPAAHPHLSKQARTTPLDTTPRPCPRPAISDSALASGVQLHESEQDGVSSRRV